MGDRDMTVRVLIQKRLHKDNIILGIHRREKQIQHKDWRLPTIQELLTLVNYKKYNPACDLEDTRKYAYWSSSTYAASTDYVWFVNFFYGYDNWDDKSSSSYYVRCVRDSEDGLEWSASSNIKMDWGGAIEYAKNLEAPVYYIGTNNG
jgi:hypothetical protein